MYDDKAACLFIRYLKELCCNLNLVLTDADYRREMAEKIKNFQIYTRSIISKIMQTALNQ